MKIVESENKITIKIPDDLVLDKFEKFKYNIELSFTKKREPKEGEFWTLKYDHDFYNDKCFYVIVALIKSPIIYKHKNNGGEYDIETHCAIRMDCNKNNIGTKIVEIPDSFIQIRQPYFSKNKKFSDDYNLELLRPSTLDEKLALKKVMNENYVIYDKKANKLLYRVRVKENDNYYYISDKFTIIETHDLRTDDDNIRYTRGNYYLSYEDAEKKLEQL